MTYPFNHAIVLSDEISEEKIVYMYPEKFQLFHKLSQMLRKAPQAVREAWILNREFTRIECLPKGYTTMDSCGCCFTEHPPGWYLGKVHEYHLVYRKCEDIYWTAICSPDGGPLGGTSGYDILESH